MLPSDAVLSASQWLHASAVAVAADLPTGQIVDEVVCAADRSQRYALYLPRAYQRIRDTTCSTRAMPTLVPSARPVIS